LKHTKNIFLISTFIISLIFSDLASPTPFLVYQPNGQEILIINRGNYLQGWHEYNGWTITKNNEGWWVYATDNNGTSLVPSNIRVAIDNEPGYDSDLIQKGIRPDPFVLIDDAPIPNLRNTRTDTFRVPLILVEFPDAFATYDSAQFDLIMNQEGYTHLNYENTGSFRDFYQEISYGEFLPVAEVTNWFMAPHNHDHYAYSNPDGYTHVRELVRAMVDSLEASGFDWSGYDNDGDGYVDALNLIHQGAGAEEGDHSNIWSHKWSLGSLAVNYDGVTINSYNMNPEIQNGNIVAIGVLAHEFGHALGLPDLYDTDYSSTGAGKLALMASGSWGTSNNSPWYPATMVGWCKNELGWVEIVEITDDQVDVTIQQTYSNNTVFRVNHSQVNEEYWLIENRQKVGSDTLMPTPGLTIWHINDDIAQGWGVNNNEPFYGVGLEQADGMFALENGGPSNGADVYPGDSDNREFSHSSNPNTTSLYNEPSMLRIDNISDPGEYMTLDVTYNEVILATASIEDGTGSAYNNGYISLSLDNEMALGQFEFELNFNPDFVDIIGINPTERVSFDSVVINNNHVTLLNPNINSGTGPILNLELFNNVGVGSDVIVSYDMCLGYTTDSSEVGITITDEGNYQIQAVDQFFNLQNSNGSIGGGASFSVLLINTVPIALTVFELSNNPEILTPSDEPFEDLNANGEYDEGEPFTDWNQNEVWSPIVEPIALNDEWEITTTVNNNNLIIGFSNWVTPLEPAQYELFKINCAVNEEAVLNDITNVYTDVQLILDAWGNSGVPYVNGSGTITINEILFNNSDYQPPTTFSLDRVYPNPFNPIINIEFSSPGNFGHINIRIFDISGKLVSRLSDKPYKAGKYTLQWHASDDISSGMYFIEFKADNYRNIQKITFLK